jgi:ribosomal protein L15
LDEIAEDNGIILKAEKVSDKFSQLIKKLYEKNGKELVVLIDEYDKPILDRLKSMKETEISIANKDILGDFYGVLKGQSQYLRFVFITGITKFSGVSVFSGLNNLMDLTLMDEYADLCGYTQKELEENFKPYIEVLSSRSGCSYEQELNEIKLWYNGYTWDGETAIYNPFSTLQLFVTGKFKTYWFDSGSPTFLIDYIKNSSVGTDQVFENESFSEIELMNFSPDKTTTTALLFKTGYLTIRKKIEVALELDEGMIETVSEYLLAMPNREVRRAFAQHILLSYVDESEMKRIINTRTEFVKAIKENNFELLSKTIKYVIDQVPTCLHNDNEAYYHSILLAGMAAIGFKVRAEVTGGMGRADIVWKFGKNRVIIEMKYLKSDEKKTSKKERSVKEKAISEKLKKLAEQAVNQIKEKKYYADYKNDPAIKIILVGVAVDGKDKIVETKIEVV